MVADAGASDANASGPLSTNETPLPAKMSVIDAQREVVELARCGPAHGPNPRVGCIILAAEDQPNAPADNQVPRRVLGYGWHRGAGTAHAEAAALADARSRAASADTAGATAIVSLEPCNHTGRTPPCSHALRAAGVAEVIYLVADPNPQATGGGAWLRQEGVRVTGPTEVEYVDGTELAPPGHVLLRPWLSAMRTGRPFVTLKLAMTLDGRIAAADGSSRWITSPQARAHAHSVRAQIDAIAIGTGTALTDDPSLTARPKQNSEPAATWQPMRVVVGTRDIGPEARLRGPGGEFVQISTHDPAQVLRELHARDVRHLLVEGGPTLASAFLRAGLVDEVHAYLAPIFLGAGKTAIDDLGISSIADALRLQTREVHRLGPDTLIIARPPIRPTPPSSGTTQES